MKKRVMSPGKIELVEMSAAEESAHIAAMPDVMVQGKKERLVEIEKMSLESAMNRIVKNDPEVVAKKAALVEAIGAAKTPGELRAVDIKNGWPK